MTTQLFSTYKTGENRVTGSTIAVLERIGGNTLQFIVQRLLADDRFELVRFENQVVSSDGSKRTSKSGVPDARIAASFDLIFEFKTTRNEIGKSDQLDRHIKSLERSGSPNRRLIVITPDGGVPQPCRELVARHAPFVVWCNFVTLNDAIAAALADRNLLIDERSSYLLRELQNMYIEEGLIDQNDVVIIPAKDAYDEYKKTHAYVCQANRPFRTGLTHLGFYRGQIEREIPAILHIKDGVEFSEQYAKELEISEDEFDKEIASVIRSLRSTRDNGRHKVFLLSSPENQETIILKAPIKNKKLDKNGKLTAWTQFQSYTSKEALKKNPSNTDELDRKSGSAGQAAVA